jgi:hypothetical protein
MDSLEDRLARLERQNRRLRAACGFAVLLALGAVAAHARLPAARAERPLIEASTLDASRLVIRDQAGRPRLILGVEKQGPGITFLEANGRTHAFLNVTSGELGRTVLEESGAHTPGLYLYDRKGTLAWHAP